MSHLSACFTLTSHPLPCLSLPPPHFPPLTVIGLEPGQEPSLLAAATAAAAAAAAAELKSTSQGRAGPGSDKIGGEEEEAERLLH